MAIYEIKNEEDQKEKNFDEEEDCDICECCGLPYDQCSCWGGPDEWDDEGETNDDDSQINDPDYIPEEDKYSYSDSDSEV